NTWLYRIVTNTSLDLLRRNKKHLNDLPIEKPQNEEDDEYFIQIEDDSSDVEEITTRKENIKAVHEAISELSDDFKKVIILFEIEQLSLTEVADILKVPVGTIKSRLFRAREKLAKILKEKGTFSM
ncbi:MAG: sigma-70 family RNA polymerase sigma factor, partial [Clostridia bacterium]|nr:sigma-70 family RNA polymerase sigma factor [Clostridia bacterium]